jgi:hypothetical protein
MKHRCKRCGKRDPRRFMTSVEHELEQKKLCFTCDFWVGHIERKNQPEVVIVHGTHYRIGKEHPNTGNFMRGFSGSRFVIKFNDGRVVESTNLWCQGTIPGEFRKELPDNAAFLQSEVGMVR